MRGWIYVIDNESMPGLVRVATTASDPVAAARELNSRGLPTPFRIVYEALIDDFMQVGAQVEKKLALRAKSGGWFNCSVFDAVLEIATVSSAKALIENAYASDATLATWHELVLRRPASDRISALLSGNCPVEAVVAVLNGEADPCVLRVAVATALDMGLSEALIDLFERLGSESEYGLQAARCSHSQGDVLSYLIANSEPDGLLISALAANPKLPTEGFETLVDYATDDVTCTALATILLANGELPLEGLHNICWYFAADEAIQELSEKHIKWDADKWKVWLLTDTASAEDEAIAEHPKCPPEILEAMIFSDDGPAALAALSNRGCPVRRLIDYTYLSVSPQDISSEADWKRRKRDAAENNPSNPIKVATDTESPDVLRTLSVSLDRRVGVCVVGNTACPVDLLDAWSRRHPTDEPIMCAIAAHKNCSNMMLRALATHQTARVRRIVASRIDCPRSLFLDFVHDADHTVRNAALDNRNCTIDAVHLLLRSPIPEWRERALCHPLFLKIQNFKV